MRQHPHRSDGYRELRLLRGHFFRRYSTTAGWAIASPGQAAIRHSSDGSNASPALRRAACSVLNIRQATVIGRRRPAPA